MYCVSGITEGLGVLEWVQERDESWEVGLPDAWCARFFILCEPFMSLGSVWLEQRAPKVKQDLLVWGRLAESMSVYCS